MAELTFSLRVLTGRLKDGYILLYRFPNTTLHLRPVTMWFDLVARNCQCFSVCAAARVFSICVLGLTTGPLIAIAVARACSSNQPLRG